MRWLIHGSITPAAIEAIKRHGHTVQTPGEAFGDDVPADDAFLKQANLKQLDVFTNDKAFAHRPFETKERFGRSIVFLRLEGGDVEQDDAIDRLFKRYKAPKPGMLYTVTEMRVKVRQLPSL